MYFFGILPIVCFVYYVCSYHTPHLQFGKFFYKIRTFLTASSPAGGEEFSNLSPSPIAPACHQAEAPSLKT